MLNIRAREILGRFCLTRSRILISGLLGFFLGLGAGFVGGWSLLVGAGIMAILGGLFWKFNRGFGICIWILTGFFVLGYGRLMGSLQVGNEYIFSLHKTVFMPGIIVSDVDIKGNRQSFEFKPDNAKTKILIYYYGNSRAEYGDRLMVYGKLQAPETFNGFNYPKYLASKNISALMQAKTLALLEKKQGNRILTEIFKIKHWFIGQIRKNVEYPYSAVVLGMLIGGQNTMPENLTQAFRISGISHVLAVSGYNISLIVIIFGNWLAGLIGRKSSFGLIIFGLGVFVVIAGAQASVLRAGIMGLALLVAQLVKRPYVSGLFLGMSAGLMTFINPLILFYDLGFGLSFAATAGIIIFCPILENLVRKCNLEFNYLWNLLAVTLAAMLTTTPLILRSFNEISVFGLITNVLILPVVPVVMLLGFLSGMPVLGTGFGFTVKIVLQYVFWVVGQVAEQKWAVVKIVDTNVVVMVWYAVLIMVVMGYMWRKNIKI